MVEATSTAALEQLKKVNFDSPQYEGPFRGDQNSDISYTAYNKYVKQDQMSPELEKAVPLSSFFQSRPTEKMIMEEFQYLGYVTETQQHFDNFVEDNAHRQYNRYTDILTYEHSRVVLKSQRGQAPKHDYINACFVDGPIVRDQIIASQGPLQTTIYDFWHMICQENVTLIVTTCKLVEGVRPKCEQFWPGDADDKVAQLIQNGRAIKVVPKGAQQLTEHLVLRTFEVTDEVYGKKNSVVKQLHYTGWPDHGVPTGASMESFTLMLDMFVEHVLTTGGADEKSIVHCSAGIGRTGTTIALAHLLVNTWAQLNAGISDPLISVFNTVRRMREQRYGLVQMPQQYEFIYQQLRTSLQSQGVLQ